MSFINAIQLPRISAFKVTTKDVLKIGALAMAASIVFALMAHAGSGGTEFDPVWTSIKDWTQGTLGRIIAGALILVGIIGGVARQSLIAFAIGIGGGMGLFYSPDILESIMTATLPHATTALQLANGLGM